jgi:hypothetical protein
MLNDDARELLASGVVMYVATRDADLAPELTGGMGIDVRGPSAVVIYLPASAATTRTLRNLEANGLVSVTCCRPIDHRTLQIRGRARSLRDAGPDDRCPQELYRGALAEQLALVGVPRSVTRRLRFSPATAVEIDVTEVFDQTPGPRAGQRIAGP